MAAGSLGLLAIVPSLLVPAYLAVVYRLSPCCQMLELEREVFILCSFTAGPDYTAPLR